MVDGFKLRAALVGTFLAYLSQVSKKNRSMSKRASGQQGAPFKACKRMHGWFI